MNDRAGTIELNGIGASIVAEGVPAASGIAAGGVFGRPCEVVRSAPGSAKLFGTIAGGTGVRAAVVGVIEAAIKAGHQFNDRVIAASACQSRLPPTTRPGRSTGTSHGDARAVTPAMANTATPGGLSTFLPGATPTPVPLPQQIVLAWPISPARRPELTAPDVVSSDTASRDD